MDSESWLSPILFIIFLIVSSFFSGAETACFALEISDKRKLKDSVKSSKQAKRLSRLLENPKRLLATILIGNTAANVGAATIAALLTHRLFQSTPYAHWGFLVDILVVTSLILLFSEILPKVIAVKNPLHFALKISWPLTIVSVLFTPLAYVFEHFARGFLHVLRIQSEVPFVSEDELKTFIEIGEDQGTLDQAEREMIHSIFEFRETMVKEVMVPRMDMVCVEQETSLDEVLEIVREKGHSRIPIYQGKIDNIVGILYVKDLLSTSKNGKTRNDLTKYGRKPYFVPESKLIDELLREFQKERTHMAIVVDEYGGTAGIITLEDVLEEIVGEIRDEYDREKPLIQSIDEKTWIVDAKVNIDELNEAIGSDLPVEEDFESLGGFIFHQLGSIPKEKEILVFDNFQFQVEKVVGRRIKGVRIETCSEKRNALEK